MGGEDALLAVAGFTATGYPVNPRELLESGGSTLPSNEEFEEKAGAAEKATTASLGTRELAAMLRKAASSGSQEEAGIETYTIQRPRIGGGYTPNVPSGGVSLGAVEAPRVYGASTVRRGVREKIEL